MATFNTIEKLINPVSDDMVSFRHTLEAVADFESPEIARVVEIFPLRDLSFAKYRYKHISEYILEISQSICNTEKKELDTVTVERNLKRIRTLIVSGFKLHNFSAVVLEVTTIKGDDHIASRIMYKTQESDRWSEDVIVAFKPFLSEPHPSRTKHLQRTTIVSKQPK